MRDSKVGVEDPAGGCHDTETNPEPIGYI